MARSNGTAATATRAVLYFSACAVLASCAGLESWEQFSGGTPDLPDAGDGHSGEVRPDAGARTEDAGTADAGTEDAGAEAAIAFVQLNYAVSESSVTSLQAHYKDAQKAGDLNVVVVGWYNLDASVMDPVTDSIGNTYRLAVGPTQVGGTDPIQQAIYYAPAIAAAAPGNIVTVRWNKSNSGGDVRVIEYSGLSATEPLDVVVASSGNGLLATSATVTTKFAPELLVAAGTTGGTFTSVGSMFNLRVVTSQSDIAADRIVNAVGTYSADAPLASKDSWVIQLAAFH